MRKLLLHFRDFCAGILLFPNPKTFWFIGSRQCKNHPSPAQRSYIECVFTPRREKPSVGIYTMVTSARRRSTWQRHRMLTRIVLYIICVHLLYLFYFFLFIFRKVKTSRTTLAQVIRLIRVYIASQYILLGGIAGLAIILSYLRRDEVSRDVGNIIKIKSYFFPMIAKNYSLPHRTYTSFF